MLTPYELGRVAYTMRTDEVAMKATAEQYPTAYEYDCYVRGYYDAEYAIKGGTPDYIPYHLRNSVVY